MDLALLVCQRQQRRRKEHGLVIRMRDHEQHRLRVRGREVLRARVASVALLLLLLHLEERQCREQNVHGQDPALDRVQRID